MASPSCFLRPGAWVTVSDMPRWLICLVLLIAPLPALAHNVIENSMDVVVWPDHVSVDARISIEELAVAEHMQSDSGRISPAELSRAVQSHSAYLLEHLKISTDGNVLAGKIVSMRPPLAGFSGLSLDSRAFVLYHLDYLASHHPIQLVRLEQNVLSEFQNAVGGWQVAFALRFRQSNQPSWDQDLLSQSQVAEFGCDWTTPPSAAPPPSRAAFVFLSYLRHGVEHILTGLDHLLFVCALALAVSRLWDLVKVVTAFTVAHSITLTMATLNWASLPPRIVEPIIALSIILVAAQNIISPRSSRGRLRLAVAFGFGLFHGLGFASDLKASMLGMSTASLIAALVAFTIGVEAGHQIVVLPLFGALKLARKESAAPTLHAMRWGSAAISLAGLYFLYVAVR